MKYSSSSSSSSSENKNPYKLVDSFENQAHTYIRGESFMGLCLCAVFYERKKNRKKKWGKQENKEEI